MQGRQGSADVMPQGGLLPRQPGFIQNQYLIDEGLEVEGLGFKLLLALEPGKGHQVLGYIDQPVGMAFYDFKVTPAGRPASVIKHGFHKPLDGGQGRAQLMGHIDHESFFRRSSFFISEISSSTSSIPCFCPKSDALQRMCCQQWTLPRYAADGPHAPLYNATELGHANDFPVKPPFKALIRGDAPEGAIGKRYSSVIIKHQQSFVHGCDNIVKLLLLQGYLVERALIFSVMVLKLSANPLSSSLLSKKHARSPVWQ